MLAVASEHGPAAANVIERSFLDGLEPDARHSAEASIDLDAAVNACPACGERIDGLPSRCPSCGLRIA